MFGKRSIQGFLAVLAVVTVATGPASAGDFTWLPLSGNWNDSSHWTPTGVPSSAGDTATINATGSGAYTVTLNVDPTLDGFTLNSADATFFASGRTLTLNGPSVLSAGSVLWRGSAWAGTGTLTIGTSEVFQGSSAVNCPLVQNGSILVQGAIAGHALLTAANGFINSGTITLQSIDGPYESSLAVTSGTLVNAGGGVIEVNAGTGGSRYITANLTNNGTVNLNTATYLFKTGGMYTTNNNTFSIAASGSLSIGGSGQVFNQDAGTLTADGDFFLSGTTFNLNGGTIAAGRTFCVECGAFNFNGGTITGAPVLWDSALTIGPGATGAGSFTMRGWGSTLSGDIHSGQSILVQGFQLFRGLLTAANGFTNSGTITLESTDSAYESNLAVTSGTLVNASGGVINVNAGSGGTRYITANLTNNGTVNLNTATTFNKDGAVCTNNNTFNIAAGGSLIGKWSNPVFNQNAGTLNIDGECELSDVLFNYNGGTINGTPVLKGGTLRIGLGAANPASFIVRESGNGLIGDVHAGQTILVQATSSSGVWLTAASGGFTNSGTITLDSATYYTDCGLAVPYNGTLTNAPGGVININGTWGGTIEGNLTNDGQINVNAAGTCFRPGQLPGFAYNNNGAINIAPSGSLWVPFPAIFSQNAGMLNIDGMVELWDPIFILNGGTVDIDGSFSLRMYRVGGTRFIYNGGTINGTPMLTNVALSIGSGATSPASFTMQGWGSTLSGDVHSGQSILVQGYSGANALLTAANGFANSGTITLDSINSGYQSNLAVTSGTLVNAGGGIINVNAGTGGTRSITANLTNNGTVNLNTSTTFNKTGGVYTNNNAFNILSTSATVTFTGSTFTNGPSGIITGVGTLDVSGVTFTNNGQVNPGLSPGTLQVTGAYRQGSDGTLNIELGGRAAGTEFDRLVVTGNAALDGALSINLNNSFVPLDGDLFTVMTYGSRIGMFGTVNGRDLGGGLKFGLRYGATDLTLVVARPLLGDANWDGHVDFTDYQILEANFGITTSVTWEMGDFDGNGAVTFTDYQMLESNFGSSIPEPATLGLLALGGLALMRRRR